MFVLYLSAPPRYSAMFVLYFSAPPRYSAMFQALYFRNDCINLLVRYTVGKPIKRSNWRQIYFVHRHNNPLASASSIAVPHQVIGVLLFCCDFPTSDEIVAVLTNFSQNIEQHLLSGHFFASDSVF